MQALWWCRLCDYLRIQWRTYRTFFIWLAFFVVVGVVLGIVSIVLGGVEADEINYNLIDGNILNATSIDASMGGFIWQRILSLAIPVIVVFVGSIFSGFTALIIFPVVLMQGYWLSVAIWWVFFYYSLPAILLIIFYAAWLLLVTVILLIALVWAYQWGGYCRGCRGRHPWGAIFRGICIIVGLAVVLGFLEYLVFWTILGKIVYKAR